jgi:hypothetical protein
LASLAGLLLLVPLQSVAFSGHLWRSWPHNIKMLVSGYHSIDMHFIMLHVKFDNELSISVLRNKQLYKKRDVKNSYFQFQIPPFGERTDLGKVSLFWRSFFL